MTKKIYINDTTRAVCETALAIGARWWVHPGSKGFEIVFFKDLHHLQYRTFEFLIRLSVRIEDAVNGLGGWGEIETQWVWTEAIDAILDIIFREMKNYGTLRALENDLSWMIITVLQRRDK